MVIGSQLRFAVAGTGRMAATMVTAIRRCQAGTVVAVCSDDRQRALAFADRHGITVADDDLAGICRSAGVDVVYVANATHRHAASSITALEAGKPVLCEKPCALTGDDARQVLEAADRSGRFFMEAMWTLVLPAYRRLADHVRQRTVGDPVHLTFDFGYPVAAQDRPRLTDPKDGGVLFDRGCYGVALALSLFGSVSKTWADVQEATASLSLTHADGTTSAITVSAEALLGNAVSIAGTEGMVGLSPPSIGAERLWRRGTAPVSVGAPSDGWRDRLRGIPALRRLRAELDRPHVEWLPYGASPFGPMLTHVAERISAGAMASDIMPPSLSLATVELLEKASKSRVPGP